MNEMFPSVNVLGDKLKPCSSGPVTGFFRDGCCNTSLDDRGLHTVCVKLTQKFLEFSKSYGNDLSTPQPQFDFPGLKPGDKWCLCAGRWLEAHERGKAPAIYLESTHEETLAIIPLSVLKEYAVELM